MSEPGAAVTQQEATGQPRTNETEITLGVLNAIDEDSGVTQRSMASDLGIALGLANAYLKRCVKKGLIKVRQVPPNRYLYYLTPQGFSEKTRLTSEYLSSSLRFFRKARLECGELMGRCDRQGWHRVALYGTGDLAEIATLCTGDTGVSLVGIIDPGSRATKFAGLTVWKSLADAGPVDAVMITALRGSETALEALAGALPAERVLTPRLLGSGRSKRAPQRRQV